MKYRTHYEYELAQAREEEFRDDLERRHRDNPAFWHWYEARREARLAAKSEKTEVTNA